MKKHKTSISRLSRREIERKFSSNRKLNKNDLMEILYKMKYYLAPELSTIILANLDDENRTFITGCPLPQSYNDLRTHGNTKFKNSFHCEINWITISICSHFIEINLFLKYEKKFETQFLLGNYKNALEIIEKIDSEICVSHWSIEKRLLLAEHAPDIQNKSELTSLIKNNCETLIKLNSSYLRTRFDYQIPPNKYDEIIEKFAEKQKNQVLSKYFLFRLNYYNNLIIYHPEIALFFESNLSIIDRYQIFIQISLSLICNQTPNNVYLESLIPCINSINKVIEDFRLSNMLIYSGFENKKDISEDLNSFYNIREYFISNKFDTCYESAFEYINSKPYCIEIVELLVKSALILKKDCPAIDEKDSFINRIILCLYNVFSKNKDYEISMYTLTKISKSISSPIWCYRLIDVLNYEQQSAKIENYNFDLHKVLSCLMISPEIDLYLHNEDKLNSFKELFKSNNSIYSIIGKTSNIDTQIIIDPQEGFFYNLSIVNSLFTQNKYALTLDAIDQLNSTDNYNEFLCLPFVNIDIIKKKAQSLYKLNDLSNALELICKSIVVNNYFLTLNDNDFLKTILNSKDPKIQENICTPIIARFYNEKTNEIWIAYDNFMYRQNYTYPTELFESSLFEKDLLKYFLRFVCIQDIYDSSPAFNNPEELDNERIKICNYLCIIDPGKKETYIKEISDIETKALIKKGLKEIDESKIFVDTTGIWREIEFDIKERFLRGKELLKLSKDEVDYLLEMSSSVLYLFQPNKDDDGTIIKFNYSRDKHEELINHPHYINFKETFLLIRDRFISSNEFGLDSYISMRIRHGTLLGQIRSIFERYNLITKKSATTNQYIENEYWLSKIEANKSKSIISEKLDGFSNMIDTMSDQIKNSFLQIKTEEKTSSGLFDFKYDDKMLIDLYDKKFYPIENYQAFYDTTVDCLWQRTESNLSLIRDKFTREFSIDVLDSLENMFSSIEKTKKTDAIDTNEFLRDITACKTDTTNTFEKIALWFRRSYSNSINEFKISLVTSICFSIVNKIHPQTPILSPEISINCDVILQGKYFTFFIDIMRNILDNIVVRSELTEPELKVKLNVTKDFGILKISIENNVSNLVNLANANKRIATIQYRIDNTENDALLKKEGGSGYIKINNIIKKVLKRNNYVLKLEQIKDDRIFRSFISFELEGLIK